MVITEIQDQIDKIIVKKEEIEEKGVNTKSMKAEREEEYKTKLEEIDRENQEKIAAMREDYLKKIKAAKNPHEKDKLLEEMGKRLKRVEDDLTDDKKRQEANLMKMLKAR